MIENVASNLDAKNSDGKCASNPVVALPPYYSDRTVAARQTFQYASNYWFLRLALKASRSQSAAVRGRAFSNSGIGLKGGFNEAP
jgi:hypothetical protein